MLIGAMLTRQRENPASAWVRTVKYLCIPLGVIAMRVTGVTAFGVVLAAALAMNVLAADKPAEKAKDFPPAASGPIQTGKGHLFACTDYSGGKVFVVNVEGKVEWQYDKAPSSNDLWVLPNGNVLFVTGRGVKEMTRDNKEVFTYEGSKVSSKGKDGKVTESPSEIYACQRLSNGNTFIAECNSGRLLEVDSSGKVVKDVRLLPEGTNGGHAYMRNARVLPNGNYLVSHYGGDTVKEYDPQGKVIMEIPAPGHPHSAIRLPSGNTLIATGDGKGGKRLFEVDKEGKTVWEVKDGDLGEVSIKFLTGFHRLPNGNTVVSNWLGHGNFGKAPHLIEITPDKKVVWTFSDFKTMKTISSVQILDVPGDAVKGEVLH